VVWWLFHIVVTSLVHQQCCVTSSWVNAEMGDQKLIIHWCNLLVFNQAARASMGRCNECRRQLRPPLGKNQSLKQALLPGLLAYQPGWLKALAVNKASHLTNLVCIYATLIGFNPHWLRAPQSEWFPMQWILVFAEIIFLTVVCCCKC